MNEYIPEKYRNKPTLLIDDVKDILNISRSKAYDLASKNVFPVKKLDHSIRIPTIPFFKWLNESDYLNS